MECCRSNCKRRAEKGGFCECHHEELVRHSERVEAVRPKESDPMEKLSEGTPFDGFNELTFDLRASGVIAPFVLDGPMDGECFLAYVRQFLTPALEPGDLVVMDNLSSHKQSAVGDTIRQAGAEVYYLPPYSPDLNPIEKMFSKLKTLLRMSAERTTEGLWNRIGVLVDEFTPGECLNYIRSCGYTAQES